MLPLGDLLARLDAIGSRAPPALGGGTPPPPGGAGPPRSASPARGTDANPRPSTPARTGAGRDSIADQLHRIAGIPRTDAPNSDANELHPPTVHVHVPVAESPSPSPGIAWRELAPFDAYEALLARIRDEHELLHAVLFELGLVHLGEGAVELACEPRGVARHTLRSRPELEVAFEQATARWFGEPMRLRIVEGTPALPQPASLSLVEASRAQERRAQAESDARADPGVQRVLDLFDGVIESVEPP